MFFNSLQHLSQLSLQKLSRKWMQVTSQSSFTVQHSCKIIGLVFLMAVLLTGCQVQLPEAEQQSLKVLVDLGKKPLADNISSDYTNTISENGTTNVSSTNGNTNNLRTIAKYKTPQTQPESLQPTPVKTAPVQPNPVQQTTDSESPAQPKNQPKVLATTVVLIGALVHPLGAENPQFITLDGNGYELVANHTDYDIYSVRKDVPYLMVKLQVVGSRDKVLTAELLEVVAEGKVIRASLEKDKHKGQPQFKSKNKHYVVTENRSGKDLSKDVYEDSYLFIQEVGEEQGRVRVIIYDIY